VRLVAIVILVSLMGPPALAKPEPRRRECHRLNSQIARYQGDVERARERGNELWENATLQHIERLSERRARRCPQYAEAENAAKRAAMQMREFGRMLGTAAKLAAEYFTSGGF
jgi:hypothetical protein